MRISDWSSDVCSSDLDDRNGHVLKTLIPPPRGHHDVIQRRPLQSQWLTSCHAARITILRKSRRRKRHGSGSHGSARYGGHEMITHIPSPECASFPKLLIFLRCRASGGGLIPPPRVRHSYSACLCIIMFMVNIVPQLIRSIRCRNRYRKSGVKGKSLSVSVDLGGSSIIKKKKKNKNR